MSAMIATKNIYDLGIIGGGIVGLAAARQVASRHPKLKICVLEKEKELASHQSKRNSGVVHQGIYYKKGSFKSKYCIKGAKQVLEYCQTKNIPLKQCGKLIVATKQHQLEQLHNLFKNAQENQLDGVAMVNSEAIQEIQPGCTKAIEALWSPKTSIVDWQQVAKSYAHDFEQLGGKVITNFCVMDMEPRDNSNINLVDKSQNKSFECKSVVCCAGLYSHIFATKTGNNGYPMVIPFKGLYFHLSDKIAQSIKTNIYPVPDPKLPFLGLHITPRLDGSVIIGPTAYLSLGYENYTSQMRLSHFYEIVFNYGLVNLFKKKELWTAMMNETKRVMSLRVLANEVNELVSEITESDLTDNNFCGIRAQCVSRRGDLVDDFLFEQGSMSEFNRVVHVRNCPSPAATSALAISERIADIFEEQLI